MDRRDVRDLIQQPQHPRPVRECLARVLTAAMVAQLFAQGRQPIQIARQLDLAKSTVNYHLSRLGLKAGLGYVGRRVLIEVLGRSGVRASELCDIEIGHVRLHDPDGARFHIPDANTETGIREVQMSLDLVEAVVEHLIGCSGSERGSDPRTI